MITKLKLWPLEFWVIKENFGQMWILNKDSSKLKFDKIGQFFKIIQTLKKLKILKKNKIVNFPILGPKQKFRSKFWIKIYKNRKSLKWPILHIIQNCSKEKTLNDK